MSAYWYCLRALILRAEADYQYEPVSALDIDHSGPGGEPVTTVMREMGLSLIFIAHDLAVVNIFDRVLVMYPDMWNLGTYDEVYR